MKRNYWWGLWNWFVAAGVFILYTIKMYDTIINIHNYTGWNALWKWLIAFICSLVVLVAVSVSIYVFSPKIEEDKENSLG